MATTKKTPARATRTTTTKRTTATPPVGKRLLARKPKRAPERPIPATGRKVIRRKGRSG
jgi:hypothetical protein